VRSGFGRNASKFEVILGRGTRLRALEPAMTH
jgi:hypothetical protein